MATAVNPVLSRKSRILSLAPKVNKCAAAMIARMPFGVLHSELRGDLISAGWLGAIQAVDRYASALGCGLETFAAFRIRGAMFDYLRSIDPLPHNTRRLVKQGVAFAPIHIPLDDPDNGLTIADTRANMRAVDARIDVAILRERARLTPRVLDILRMYYEEERTDPEIGLSMNLTQGRVWQLRNDALGRMRKAA